MELHTQTRINMNPDPEYDCIQGIFYTIFNMSENSLRTGKYINLKGKLIFQYIIYISIYQVLFW